jgi:hypothetical protein
LPGFRPSSPPPRLKEAPAGRPGRLLAGLLLLAAAGRPAHAAPPPPDRVTGPETCVECHLDEIEVWKRTVHNKTFRELPRRPETAAMLAKLGLGKVTVETQCRDCHFLSKIEEEERINVAGIACESCHGAARDWAKTHGDYGHGITAETESPDHRDARWAQAEKAGLVRPRNLYTLGAACYECHILADEKVINVGGHIAGSAGFNLLTWSQGEVRHTIPRTGKKVNPEATPAHRRVLFVTGCILETEYCFRAVAQATEKAAFGITQAHRADAARQLLEKIAVLAPAAGLDPIVAVAKATRLRLNNRAELLAAADRIAALGRAFVAGADGEKLAAIDPLVPGPELYKGEPYKPPGAP